jgi:hypothetical protein
VTGRAAALRPLGWLPLAAYAVHAGFQAWRGHAEYALWSCHVAALLVGAGLLGPWPTANAVGVLWLVLGVPLWLIDVARGGEFYPTTLLTHVGAFALALVAVAWLGWPPGAWWKGLAGLLALVVVSRLVTPDLADVNGAYTLFPRSGPGWAALLSGIPLVGGFFLVIERAATRAVGG